MEDCFQDLINVYDLRQMTVLQVAELIKHVKKLPSWPYLRPVLSKNLEKNDFNLFPNSIQQNNKIFLYYHSGISIRM